MQFGTDTYRTGALERLEDSRRLKDAKVGHDVGSMYLAGLAVEGMLRSLLWLRDKQFDERHDLRQLAIRIGELGLLRAGGRDDDFVTLVQGVVRHWVNDLRFAGAEQSIQWYQQTRALRKSDEGALRKLCKEHWDQCSEVIRRCEVLWQRSRHK